MPRVLDGMAIAAEIKQEVAEEVRALAARGIRPGLAAVLVGNGSASEIYVRNKVRICGEVGIYSDLITRPETVTTAELLELVASQTEPIMKEIFTFLNFDGYCREAMEFYKTCFAAEVFLLPYSEAPGDFPWVTEETKDKIMHSSLTKGSLTILMGADTISSRPFQQGNNFSVTIHCESLQEIDALFTALGVNFLKAFAMD